MDSNHGGGPAFPQHGWSKDPATVERMQAVQGMTMLDYFAAAALQGQLANPIEGEFPVKPEACETRATAIVEWSFKIARDMLAERQKASGQ